MKHHDLKILPPYFEAVARDEKLFEIRRDDRNFNVGDTVRLLEHDSESGYTGRVINDLVITCVVRYMQRRGYVVFGFKQTPQRNKND